MKTGHADQDPFAQASDRVGSGWTPGAVVDWIVPGGLQASRDGTTLVAGFRHPDLARNRSEEWIARLTPAGFLPVSEGPHDILGRLSPDGRRLLYVRRESRRDYLRLTGVDEAMSSAASVTISLPPMRVRDMAWSPEGEYIAVLAGSGSGTSVLLLACDGRISSELASSPGSYRLPTWLPAGDLVVAATISDPDGLTEVLQVLHRDAKPVVLGSFRGRIGATAVSPRGDALVFTGVPTGDHPVAREPHLYRCELANLRKTVDVTAHWDRPVGVSLPGSPASLDVHPLQFSPGGTLYAIVANQGRSDVYRFMDFARHPEVLPGLPPTVLDLAAFEGGVWIVGATPTDPPEVYRWADRSERRTHLHESRLQTRPVLEPEPFTINSGRYAVCGFRVRPRGKTPHPAVLLLHGGPGGGFGPAFHAGAQLLAARGYLVLMANPRGSTSYGSAFSDGVVGDPGGGDFQDLMAVLDDHLSAALADPTRLAVVGYGYGGFLAAWAITQTDRFQAAVLGAPAVNWFSLYGTTADTGRAWFEALIGGPPWEHLELSIGRSPLAHAGQVRTPTLLVAGAHDHLFPPSEARQFANALERLNVSHRIVELAGAGHTLDAPRARATLWRETLTWLDHWLGAEN